MQTSIAPQLQPPRFEHRDTFTLVGLAERYTMQETSGIPDQWNRFMPFLGNIPGQVENVAYGAVYDFDEHNSFAYLCAVEVTGISDVPNGFTSLEVPASKYVVFTDTGHVSGIQNTIAAIWREWFPPSEVKAAAGPTMERYGPEFDPETGMGGFEIWIPVDG